MNSITHKHCDWIKDEHVTVPRRIVCAAIRYGDVIVCSARHHDRLMNDTIKKMGGREKLLDGAEKEEQGFIDQYGDYFTREEAAFIVRENGQQVRNPDFKQYLCSEDLY